MSQFDSDKDGKITINDLLSNKLLPEADVDLLDAKGQPGTDGVNDSLSLGVNVKAVKAIIKSK